jgi:hypothetical protein
MVKFYYVLILIFILVLVNFVFRKNKLSCSLELFNENQNLYNKELPNIFFNDNTKYLNEKNNQNIKKVPLSKLFYDSYIYSDKNSNKIICSNYMNEADCWANNYCQWIYGFDNKSYCELAPKWLL